MNIEQFIKDNSTTIIVAIVTGVLVYFSKKILQKIFRWLGEAFLWLIGLLGIHVLLLRRFKKSLIKAFQETTIGYRSHRIDLDKNYITLKLAADDFIRAEDRDSTWTTRPHGKDAVEFLSHKKNRHVAILGHPGSGKTTLLQHQLLRYVNNCKNANRIPVFITLRDLKGRKFLDYMKDFFRIHKFNRFGYIKRKLKKGRCLVMFDGLDEISNLEIRKEMMTQINEFSSEFSENQIIVTSRIEGFIHHVLLASFHEREILDLDATERRNFITGILPVSENPERLIRQIEEQRGIQRLAVRPLTLALLTFIYQETHSLPENRIRVYETCIHLMFEDRDISRGIYAYRNKFKSELKAQILRKISLEFIQEGKQSFCYQELKDKIGATVRISELPQINVDDLIVELTQANGIFRRKTREEYDFAHLTFQEYFAARQLQSLNEQEREQLWREKLSQDTWREVLLFYSQLCDSPGKIVEEALRSEDIWYAGELALCASGRLPESIRWQTLHLIIDQSLKDVGKQLNINKVDLINDLSRDGLDIVAYEKISLLLKAMGDKISTESVDLNKRLKEFIKEQIGKKNFDGKHPGMVCIPEGAFKYQGNKMISLPGFWISLFPITNKDFKAFVNAIGLFGLSSLNEDFQKKWQAEQKAKRAKHPVRYITWYEAALYCNWRSQKEGLEPAYDEKKKEFITERNGYRLPTEQEWEKAAGWDDLQQKARTYPWGDEFDPTRCNNSVKGGSKDTSDVNKYENGLSFYGCYDMAGNVWEWTDSWCTKDKKGRVVRGCSWGSILVINYCCANRYVILPDIRDVILGFRVVRSAQL